MIRQDNWKTPAGSFWLALIIVSGAHFALRTSRVDLGGRSRPAPSAEQAPVEVWSKGDQDREVVFTLRSPENPALKDKPARFYGEFRNRTETETRAPKFGQLTPAPQNDLPLGEGGLAQLMPFGASPNALPEDIKKGNHTVLNTDAVTYASFINRIAEEIYDGWAVRARSAVENLSESKRSKTDLYVTRIQVTLNENGEVSAVQVLKASGEESIDSAPGKAFWDASRFPNPPSQLVQQDGFVRLPFEFILEVNRSIFNVVPLRV